MVRYGTIRLRHGGTGGQRWTGEAVLHPELSLPLPRQPPGKQRPISRLRSVPQTRSRPVSSDDERCVCPQLLQLPLRSCIPGTIYVAGNVVCADSRPESYREQCEFCSAGGCCSACSHQQIRHKIKRHDVYATHYTFCQKKIEFKVDVVSCKICQL